MTARCVDCFSAWTARAAPCVTGPRSLCAETAPISRPTQRGTFGDPDPCSSQRPPKRSANFWSLSCLSMNKKTLNALRSSIRHWKRLEKGRTRANEGIGPAYCALCRMFYFENYRPGRDICNHARSYDAVCLGCPVRERTGQKLCGGTPYADAEKAWMLEELDGIGSAAFKAAAKKEREFLQSLLPPGSDAQHEQ